MAAYDGTISINTKIDEGGFNKGTKNIDKGVQNISGSLKQLMKAMEGAARGIGAAFWAGTIIAFAKTSISAFSMMSSDFGRELKSLQWAMLGLQGALVNALAPAFAAIYPYILSAIHFLTQLFTTISQLSLAFFGLATSLNAAKLAQQEMTKAVGAGAMASFDQLNVLNAKPMLPGVEIPPGMLESVEAFKLKMLELLAPVGAAFDRLKASLEPLGQTIWAGLKWAWDNLLVPLANWAITNLLPAFLDLVSGAAKVLNEVLIAIKPAATWLFENFLKPLAEWTGKVIIEALKWLTDRLIDFSGWVRDNQSTVEGITKFLMAFAAVWGLINLAVGIWNVIGVVATAVTGAFGAAVAFLTSPIGLVVLAIVAIIAIIALLIANWDWVSQKAGEAWEWIKGIWTAAGSWFMTNVVDPIKAAFQPVFDWLGKAWETVWNGIGDVVKGVVNTIIDFINTMIRAIAGGINAVVDAMNTISVSIPSWVPFIGGQTWGLNIPRVGVPQIPRLATGAVIPPNAQFAAILGDQSSGRNIEAPENLMRQIISEELGKIQADITIRFDGTMAQFVQQLKPVLDRENVRIGGNLIQGVVRV